MKLPRRDFRFAVEFRHLVNRPAYSRQSRQCGSDSSLDWHHPHLIHFFQKFGICWVWNDLSPLQQARRAAFEFVPETTDFLYVRLMGDLSTKYDEDGTACRYGSLLWPRSESLENWAKKVANHPGLRVYFYANNHFEGSAPLTCQRLARQFGLQLTLPSPEQEPTKQNEQLSLAL